LTQLCIPPASPHIHNLSLYGTHYDLDELLLESSVQVLKELKLPSRTHTTDHVLQKGEFKSKYVKVKKFLLDGSFVLSYIRRSNYTPSTISREIHDIYDKVYIHTTSLVSQNLEGFTSFYNLYQLLQSEQNPYKNLITSIMQSNLQIMPFKSLSKILKSSNNR